MLESAFRLPSYVSQALEQAVDFLGYAPLPPETAIWLEFPSPRGYLHMVPWERLLAPLGRPVLRLPYHTLRPQATAGSLEIALCASAPMAKSPFDAAEVLEQLARMWVEHARHEVTVHLFTDVSSYERLSYSTADLATAVAVYNPHEADQYAVPERTTQVRESTTITSPWLLWIRDSLQGRALDVIHFVSHGYLSGDRGAIALASAPTRNTDRSFSRCVGATETSAFLSQVGAWALALTGPPSNYSGAGLRALGDAIALARPGISVVHELTLDPDDTQLARTVEMIVGGGVPVTGAIPGITCWVNPRFVDYPQAEQDALLLTQDGHSSLIKGATRDALARGNTPAWVAASTRYLESQQADWLPETPGEQTDPDAVAALQSVSSLLEKHVSQHLGDEAAETS